MRSLYASVRFSVNVWTKQQRAAPRFATLSSRRSGLMTQWSPIVWTGALAAPMDWWTLWSFWGLMRGTEFCQMYIVFYMFSVIWGQINFVTPFIRQWIKTVRLNLQRNHSERFKTFMRWGHLTKPDDMTLIDKGLLFSHVPKGFMNNCAVCFRYLRTNAWGVQHPPPGPAWIKMKK